MSKEATPVVETVTEVLDVELNELLGGGASIMTAGEEKKEEKKIFSPMAPDLGFLNDDIKKTPAVSVPKPEEKKVEDMTEEEKAAKVIADAAAAEEAAKPAPTTEEIAATLEIEDPAAAAEAAATATAVGLGHISVAKDLIEKGLMLPFEDGTKVEDYTPEDVAELFQANIKQKEEALQGQVTQQFFESLPPLMQQAYGYIHEGGTDLEGMFRALSQTSEIQNADIATEDGQKYTVRTFLQATNFGSPDEIEDEINTLDDRGDLKKRAEQFKPKLDGMQEQIVNQKIQDAAAQTKQRQAQSQGYIDSVYSTLEKGDLNGMKLDNQTQNMLYVGLTQSNYPSISGKQTNLLGHLLEKHQWVEPNHPLLAEALYLLQDPEGYKKSLGAEVKKDVEVAAVRALKSEQQKIASGTVAEEADTSVGKSRPGVQRTPGKNFFARQ